MKKLLSSSLNGIANFIGDYKVGRQLSTILHPLSIASPSFALLRAHLNGEMTFEEMLTHLRVTNNRPTLSCYDLVVLYHFIESCLVADELRTKNSRAEFVYFSREAGDVFYGHLKEITSLKIYVLKEEHLKTVEAAVQDKRSKMTRRNKTPFTIPMIEVVLLKDHQKPYKKWKADTFGNIPFIVDVVNLDPSVPHV